MTNRMISADTILNIINESGIETLNGMIPDIAYKLIKKKYIDNTNNIPYLKKVIKSYEKNKKKEQEILNSSNS